MSLHTEPIRFTLVNSLSELEKITDHLEAAGQQWELSNKIVIQLNLILDELFTNFVTHGCTDEFGHEITIELVKNDDEVAVTIIDDGCPFDPTSKEDPVLDVPLEEKELGGLGVFLVRQYGDNMTYEWRDNKNVVKFTKNIN